MNRNDIILIGVVLVAATILGGVLFLNRQDGKVADVFYEDKLVLSVNLMIDREYTVDGELGEVILEVKDGKIRVKSENSPRHICSKEGYTSSQSKPIICLPNKIIIKVRDDDDIDGVVY